jgi:arylformamidase
VATRYVDLSFPLEDGMPTLPGFLPEARIGAIMDHDASHERYQGKAEFYLGRVDIPGNTGTYVDAPFHRHRDRLWAVALRTCADRDEAADALQDALNPKATRAG